MTQGREKNDESVEWRPGCCVAAVAVVEVEAALAADDM